MNIFWKLLGTFRGDGGYSWAIVGREQKGIKGKLKWIHDRLYLLDREQCAAELVAKYILQFINGFMN